ncbi:NAD(P)/FAD-dependent oxidoreductase [Halobacteriales archaeon QH_10_67_22]|nr:MAG: NAD(P)/FAD-dependent oxidoreductase [Halobacteriales archaeon QH_10_67_22]
MVVADSRGTDADVDIVVAGGGPAGLQFAREVTRRSAYSVVVLEANDRLRDNDKSTGGTFDQVVEGFDVPDEVVMDANRDVVFEGPSASATLPIGVEFRENGRSEQLRADVVVDATGPAAVLADQLGMFDPAGAQRGIGKEYECTGRFDLDSMLFKFDHEAAPGGYAWTFPAGDGAFKIGVCWIDDFYERHAPAEDGAIDDYIGRWIDADDRWSVDERRAVHAGMAVSNNSLNRRATDGLVAVGDAVSSINPLFGEGIRPGMESAAMAADAVLTALDNDDPSHERLGAYERRWNERKGRQWQLQRVVAELLYDFDADQQDRFVRASDRLGAAGADRLQRYDLAVRDYLSLYPFSVGDLRKVPALARHFR